jgi:hypothetical protein
MNRELYLADGVKILVSNRIDGTREILIDGAVMPGVTGIIINQHMDDMTIATLTFFPGGVQIIDEVEP